MKSIRKDDQFRSNRTRASGFKRPLFVVVVFGVVVAISAALFVLGVESRHGIWELADDLGLPDHDRGQAVRAAPANYIRALMSGKKPEKLLIDIKFKDMEKLRAKREEALKRNVLNTTDSDFVPAEIRYGDRVLKAKVRLKGDRTDHLRGNKWSLRVQIKGDDQLFGMQRFSLMNPRVRASQEEALAYDFLKSLNLLVPRFFFVDLVINGRHIGVMALEEVPRKEMLESQGRRDSVIVRFDDSFFWDTYALNGFYDPNSDDFAYTIVRISEAGRVRRSDKLSKDQRIAVGLMRSFVEGSLKASEVFDAESFARYLAAIEVLNARSALWWANLRFYYNPITARLEPVASDVMSDDNQFNLGRSAFVQSMDLRLTRVALEDPNIRVPFLRELARLAKAIKDGSFEAFLKPLDEEYLGLLHRELPILPPFDFKRLKKRADILLTVTNENLDYFNSFGEKGHTEVLRAHITEGQKGDTLELTNILQAPLEVISMSWQPLFGGGLPEKLKAKLPLDFPLKLEATGWRLAPVVVRIPFYSPHGVRRNFKLHIVARIKDQQRTYEVNASEYIGLLDNRPIPSPTLAETLSEHPFMQDAGNGVLRIQPGRHTVWTSVATPPGYELQIPAGTTLLFTADAGLIVRGMLNMEGTETRPIVLDALQTSHDEPGWQGIFVLNAQKPSIWRHVQIRNTTGVKYAGWELTGGTNLYESEVRLESVTIQGNRAEDALNIVRSEFFLENLNISNTVSDAVDSDFSHGTVKGGVFDNIGTAGGGDAIDVSGSIVMVTGSQFHNISDKALSVGEGSQMTARDLHIDGVVTGAASKDASRLTISASVIENAQVAGLMAYVKKPQYGPASIEAEGLRFVNTPIDALAQTGSSIRIDGDLVPVRDLSVDELYKSSMKRASR